MPADTKTRILDAALALFNERGSDVMGTNHIAAAMGISPGNLYYHYRNKAEIVRRLFARIKGEWAENYALPEGVMPDPATMERMVAGNFGIQWRYRFFFRELTSLLNADPALAADYRENRRTAYANTLYLLHRFIATGAVQDPGTGQAVDDIAQLLWLVGDFWLVFREAGGGEIGPAEMDQGVRMFRRLLNPSQGNAS
jgi:AcrR family transcriptional regulator